MYTRIFSKVLFHFGPLNYNIASGFMFIAAIIDYALHGPYACLRKYKQNALNIKSKIVIRIGGIIKLLSELKVSERFIRYQVNLSKPIHMFLITSTKDF